MNYFERILHDQKLKDNLCNRLRIEFAMTIRYNKKHGMPAENSWIYECSLSHPDELDRMVESFVKSAITGKLDPYIDPNIVEHYVGPDTTYSDVQFLKRVVIGKIGFNSADEFLDSYYGDIFEEGNIEESARRITIIRRSMRIARFIESTFCSLYIFCVEDAESVEDLSDCLEAETVRLRRLDKEELYGIFLKSLIKLIDHNGSAIALANRASKALLE